MSQPFKRYVMIRAAIQAAMAVGDVGKRIDALRAIPEYRSRGKGWKGKKQLATSNPVRQTGRWNSTYDKSGAGPQECARRVRQGMSYGPAIVWQDGVALS
jgi:hypothetical protein